MRWDLSEGMSLILTSDLDCIILTVFQAERDPEEEGDYMAFEQLMAESMKKQEKDKKKDKEKPKDKHQRHDSPEASSTGKQRQDAT